MPTVLRWSESVRLVLLPLTLPLAVLWSGLPRSGGGLMVLAHALLILFYAAQLDAAALAARRDPPLALFRGRERLDLSVVRGVRTLLAGAIVLALAALVFVQWRLGVFATGAFLVIALVAGRAFRPGDHRRATVFWPEITWPLFMLIIPALVIGAQSSGGDMPADAAAPPVPGTEGPAWSMPRPVLGATVLGGIHLAAYAVLCQIRDRATTGADTVVLFVLLFASIALGVWGVEAAWWGWPAPVIASCGAILAVFALARGDEGYAVGGWTLSSAAAAIALALTAM